MVALEVLAGNAGGGYNCDYFNYKKGSQLEMENHVVVFQNMTRRPIIQ